MMGCSPDPMAKIFRGLLVAALMVSIGLHWAVLQSAAWVGMAVTYSLEKGSLVEGLSDTFDGDHPCPLCKAVESGVQAGQESGDESAPPVKVKELKLNLALVSVPTFHFLPATPTTWSTISSTAVRLTQRPVTPPPQAGC